MKQSAINNRRKNERFIKRCETEFMLNDTTYRGISSNFSPNGLYIRTNYPFPSDTILNIIIHLSTGLIANVKGRVIWAVRSHNGNIMGTSVKALKNGMGIEIIEQDDNFIQFMSSLRG